jgi:hypothetical protein
VTCSIKCDGKNGGKAVATKTKQKWVTIKDAQKILGISRPTFVKRMKLIAVEKRRGAYDYRKRYVDINNIYRQLKELDLM